MSSNSRGPSSLRNALPPILNSPRARANSSSLTTVFDAEKLVWILSFSKLLGMLCLAESSRGSSFSNRFWIESLPVAEGELSSPRALISPAISAGPMLPVKLVSCRAFSFPL